MATIIANQTILPEIADNLIRNLTNAIAALGGIIFLYLVFQLIRLYIDKKKARKIEDIETRL